MALDVEQMNEIMMMIGTGRKIEKLSFPITDEVRRAWDAIRAEMAAQPGPVVYWPVSDFSMLEKEDIKKLIKASNYTFSVK